MSCYFIKTLYSKFLLFIVVVLLTQSPIYGQAHQLFSGAVFNNNTKGPLLGVNVIIKQRFQVTVTDFECKGWFAGVASCFIRENYAEKSNQNISNS
jgi:hypothetical protein